jgi:methylphosphotriester-DNA--protein-cysteine methyltransferase
MELLDHRTYYRALQSHDARFDGHVFVGCTSTGIYCRPICPTRPPKFENCRFFASAAAAQEAGFRPCLRCRPLTLGAVNAAAEFTQPFALAALVALLGMIAALVLLPDA